MEIETTAEGTDPEITVRADTLPTESAQDSPQDIQNEFPGTESESVDDDLIEHMRALGEDDDEGKPEDKASDDDGKAKAGDKKQAKDDGKAPVRWLKDGSYEVKREDGTKVVLSEDEVRRIARRRIDRATAQLRSTERAVAEQKAQFEAQLAAARSELDQLKKKPGDGTADTDKPPMLEDFDSVEEWADARDEWKRARDAKPTTGLAPEQRAHIEDLGRRAAAMMDDGTARFENFDTVVRNNEQAPFDPVMVGFVFGETEDPTAVFYALGSDLDEARHIRTLLHHGDVKAATRAILRVEALATRGKRVDDDADSDLGHDTSVTPATAGVPAPAVTAPRTPKPISPIGRGSAPVARDPNKESYEQYRARRLKESMARL